MKRIVYFIGVVSIVFAVATSYVVKTTHASSCCDTKDAKASEKSDSCCSKEAKAAEQADNKCVVCGKAVEKDKGVKVECEGKTVTVCCKDCEATYKKDPCKFCKDEKCEKSKEKQGEAHH